MTTVVHFGAGNIGRGFLGQLYAESGFRTVFVEANPEVVRALNERGRYRITIAEESPSEVCVENVSALGLSDPEAIAQALAGADFVSTAVGVRHLESIAPLLAAGFARRDRGVDTLVCENLLNAGDFVRRAVFGDGESGGFGFVEASIGRMVPLVEASVRAGDPLAVAVEAYCELPVDREAFRQPILPIRHLRPIAPFEAYVQRKLFVHNAGHATCAYLGWARGYETIDAAIRDPLIAATVRRAMEESAEALHREFGLDQGELQAHVDDLLRRFANRALGDQVRRVAADPKRKLGRDDRFLGAIRLCLRHGIEPEGLVQGARAAFLYADPEDPIARELQRDRAEHGDEETWRTLGADDETLARVMIRR